jgi:hypothetical protein
MSAPSNTLRPRHNGGKRLRPRKRERDHDQPARDPAQPPAAPEHGHLRSVDDLAGPQGDHRDRGADGLAGPDGQQNGADVSKAVHPGSRPDQPLQNDHRHQGSRDVAGGFRQRGAEGQLPPLA